MYSISIQQTFISIQDYLIGINEVLTPAGCLIVAGVLLMLLLSLKLRKAKLPKPIEIKKPPQRVTHQHIDAIAGDDVMTTQLDLARAYIEMGERDLAKEILAQVSTEGNPVQQRQAQQLTTGL
jgi:FimV-like protein